MKTLKSLIRSIAHAFLMSALECRYFYSDNRIIE